MKIAHVITRMIIGGAQENTLLNCLDLIRHHGDEVLLVCGPSLGPEGSLLDQAGTRWTDGSEEPSTGTARGRAGQCPLERPDDSGNPATDRPASAEGSELLVREIPSLRRAIHPVHDQRASWQLKQVLRQFRPDVVHTHSAKGGMLGRQVAWKLKVPAVIHTVHGAPFHDYQPKAARILFAACERWAARRCHHMISVADAMTDLMVQARVAPRQQFTTISSGMDVQPFLEADQHRAVVRRRYGLQDHHVVVGKIARLFHLKGHADLIAAAEQVARRYPEVRFLLVGDGLLRESLQQEIHQRGLDDHFVFTGLVRPDEVPQMIGAMDLLVHTSYREGLARALPQAMIAGRPAISYDVDGAREVVIDDETGYLVAAGDLTSLADRIGRLVCDAGLREQLGRAGQQRWTDQFRHETMTCRIRELYQRVLAAGGH